MTHLGTHCNCATTMLVNHGCSKNLKLCIVAFWIRYELVGAQLATECLLPARGTGRGDVLTLCSATPASGKRHLRIRCIGCPLKPSGTPQRSITLPDKNNMTRTHHRTPYTAFVLVIWASCASGRVREGWLGEGFGIWTLLEIAGHASLR